MFLAEKLHGLLDNHLYNYVTGFLKTIATVWYVVSQLWSYHISNMHTYLYS